ncbi:MAG: oxaloacetate decarboxylase subunit alpha, partial [Oscillospiraceae bacterium]|nr:oxaloacetate decarboxylase subunit alpha [Oscillospiraceae bacterium]
MTLLKSIEAGAEIVDTAISPLAMGTSQPPTEPFVASLEGTEYDTGLDLNKLDEIARYFTPLRTKYLANGLLDPQVLKVDVNALLYQVPGGMLSNLVSQLKQAGKSDQLQEVLDEVPRVREDSGFPPLVTPTSQIVGTQAVFNVINGERYKTVTKEFRGLVRGEYGITPSPIKPEFIKKIIGDENPITYRPADDLKPELDTLREKVKPYSIQDEDVLSYALFDQVATKFFEWRADQINNIDGENSDKVLKVHTV